MKRSVAPRSRFWRWLGAAGFSAIELAVVMGISSGMSAAMYYTFAVQSWTSNRENANAMAQNAIRVAIERMVREIQTSGFDPTGKNATVVNTFGFQQTDEHTIRFTTDTNRNGLNTDGGEDRGFTFSNGAIAATSGGTTTTTLATGVQSLTFTYLDALGQAVTTPSAIREVKITATIVAKGRTPSMAPSVHTLVGTSFLRNASS